MRNFAFATLAAVSVGLVGAAPASAATTWECIGPEVACGASSAVPAPSYRTPSYSKSTASRAQKGSRSARRAISRNRVAKSSESYGGSYGGGSSGMASYYWQGSRTASGARFNPDGLTAAHRTLPFGTRVLVTNATNGRSVTVTINDRGPFIKGRVIDLSRGAASAIGMTGQGVARVSYSVQ
jgi:rare lipoprotein A